MKVIVGLGNPGPKYKDTRHNVGFEVVDEVAKQLGVRVEKERWQAQTGEGVVAGQKVLLVKPLTFMNLSGASVSQIVKFYQDLNVGSDLIVVYDDMDFPVGHLRLRENGSAGGHNGMKSIIQSIGTSDFPRVRVGIGRPDPERTVIDHVLTPFHKADRPLVQRVTERAADAALFACEHGFALAMNRFNGVVDTK